MKKRTAVSATTYLTDLFKTIEPEQEFHVTIENTGEERKVSETVMKVSIAGFSEERRIQNKKLDPLSGRTGSVFLYGKDQPDFFLILNNGKKTTALSLKNAVAKRSGLADSLLHIEAPDWNKVAKIDINIANVFGGDRGVSFFTKTLVEKINKGEMTARLGKWVSTKVFDRDIPREEADQMSVEAELRSAEGGVIRTMVIGSDIANIQYIPEKKSKEEYSVLNVRQTINTTKVPFKSIAVEYETKGKEIGAGQSRSTYVYLLGAPFNAPANLVIIRHRQKT